MTEKSKACIVLSGTVITGLTCLVVVMCVMTGAW